MPSDTASSESVLPDVSEPVSRPEPTFAVGARSDPKASVLERLRRAVVKTAGTAEDEDWMANERPAGLYDAWLGELTTPSPDLDTGIVASPRPRPIEEEDPTDDELDPSLFASDGTPVEVPRTAAIRYVVYAAVLLACVALVTAYVFGYPTYTAREYRKTLVTAFESTKPLRQEIAPSLTGPLPRDLVSESRSLRDTAAPYSEFARQVNALPPETGPLTSGGPMRPVLEARRSLQDLDQALRPAVDQIRARAAYYDTLAAVRDQMALASTGGESLFDGADLSTVVEGTVANTTSFEATLASQRPPAGFERLNAAVLAHLRDYSNIGRRYALAVRTEDPAAASLRLQLVEKAREFPAVLLEPTEAGITNSDLQSIEETAAIAAARLYV